MARRLPPFRGVWPRIHVVSGSGACSSRVKRRASSCSLPALHPGVDGPGAAPERSEAQLIHAMTWRKRIAGSSEYRAFRKRHLADRDSPGGGPIVMNTRGEPEG